MKAVLIILILAILFFIYSTNTNECSPKNISLDDINILVDHINTNDSTIQYTTFSRPVYIKDCYNNYLFPDAPIQNSQSIKTTYFDAGSVYYHWLIDSELALATKMFYQSSSSFYYPIKVDNDTLILDE